MKENISLTGSFCSAALLACLISASSCSRSMSLKDMMATVAEAKKEKDFEKARNLYFAHINKRLQVATRPKWENPYFYYLMIGDLYLEEGNPEKSLSAFEKALEHKVEQHLVDDRLLRLSQWLEEKSQYDEAINLLTKYRKRNPLLFEAALDSVSKSLTQNEIAKEASVGKPIGF